MKLDPKIEKRIDELLGVMSLTEKVGQLNQISTPRVDDEKVYEMLRQGRIGPTVRYCTRCSALPLSRGRTASP